MSCGNKFTIKRGSTWAQELMWQTGPEVYRPITGVVQLAPLRLTVPSHGLVNDQPVVITGIRGMTELNADNTPPEISDYFPIQVIDSDTIELNGINGYDLHTYVSGGIVRAFTLVDMTGFTARMDVRDSIGGALLQSFTTTLGNITINNITKKITIVLNASETEALTWDSGVFSIEMEDGSGEPAAYTIELMNGEIEVEDEVTTTETP